MLERIKSLISRVLAKIGYGVVKSNGKYKLVRSSYGSDSPWFNYTKYAPPSEQETLEKYL